MSAPNLKEYAVQIDTIAIEVAGPGGSSNGAMCHMPGRVVALEMNLDAACTADTVIDIEKNETNVSVTITVPSGAPAGGFRAELSAPLFVARGDRLQLDSQGSGSSTVNALTAAIIEANTPDLNLFYVELRNNLTWGSGAGITEFACVPFAGQLVAVVAVAQSSGGGADNTFDIYKNNADSGVIFTWPGATAADDGILMALDASLELAAGDSLRTIDNAEGNSSTGYFAWLFRHTVAPDVNQYILPDRFDGNIAAAGSTFGAVVPFAGQLVGGYVNPDATLDADTSFDILINGVDTGIDFLVDAGPADLPLAFRLTSAAPDVQPGDVVRLTSNGEATGATTPNGMVMIVGY